MAITADDESGYITYDRVLWVTNNLTKLSTALQNKRLTPSAMVNNAGIGHPAGAVYIGRNQRGTKFLALDAATDRFMLAPNPTAALNKSGLTEEMSDYIQKYFATLSCDERGYKRWDPFSEFGIQTLEFAAPTYNACSNNLMSGIATYKEQLKSTKSTQP